jgi:hypothetical protein
VIPGNHDWPDTGTLRTRDRFFCRLARRIDHANQGEKNEIPLYVGAEPIGFRRIFRQPADGDPKGSQRLGSELFVDL